MLEVAYTVHYAFHFKYRFNFQNKSGKSSLIICELNSFDGALHVEFKSSRTFNQQLVAVC